MSQSEIRLNVKTIDNTVENAVHEDGSRLDIDIALDIDRRTLRPRAILAPAFRDMCRDVLLKIDDFHCVDFVTRKHVRVSFVQTAQNNWISSDGALRLRKIHVNIKQRCVIDEPLLYLER